MTHKACRSIYKQNLLLWKIFYTQRDNTTLLRSHEVHFSCCFAIVSLLVKWKCIPHVTFVYRMEYVLLCSVKYRGILCALSSFRTIHALRGEKTYIKKNSHKMPKPESVQSGNTNKSNLDVHVVRDGSDWNFMGQSCACRTSTHILQLMTDPWYCSNLLFTINYNFKKLTFTSLHSDKYIFIDTTE